MLSHATRHRALNNAEAITKGSSLPFQKKLGPKRYEARHAYMKAALAKRRVRDFPVPEPIVFARIDRKTGLLADESSRNTVFQSFLVDTVPTESAGKAQNRDEGRRLLRMDDF